MAEFVLSPNLPLAAGTVIIGQKYADLLEKPLQNLNIHPLFVPDNPGVDARLSGHADLSVFHAGGERLWLAPYLRETDFSKALQKLGTDTVYADITQREAYPHDAQLNIAAFGRTFFYSPKASYPPIVEYLTSVRAMQPLSIKQGYAKCSALIVDERSIISQDRGLTRAAAAAGLDVLQISPGHVALDGFEYGFLGGAGFKISRDKLCFTGVLDEHPDKWRILDFLSARGIRPLYLTGRPVFDIGSAIPLTEK